ncbi:hypothetical protein OJ996_16540 [Luteolibacter sp. GHJ8]|jgi:hypothetical protein|uniref:Uncharacterized protein n=1 Tax=Luteolibacter rhizosphaerae TaxID=2989719 RepID=A0ABT3G6B2_9BACT|nr:hypothetical protein [Luteolibacter rhizosphaerae]MCW1915197.1 hypothetical protein [Luteolibacter rhizosphaerae]
MPYAYLILPAIVCCGLIAGWILARILERRYYRGHGSSEEILDELELAYTPRRGIEIRTQSEYLPYVFGCIVENVDSGFEEKQVRNLLDRIEEPRPNAAKNALFPVKVSGVRSEIDLQWSRDNENRVRIFVLAAPKVIRALKKQVKSIPRALAGN